LLHLLLCLPLHLRLPGGARPLAAPAPAPDRRGRDHTLAEALRDPVFWKLAFAFSTNMFIFSAMAVHLIPLLQRFGHSAAAAVLAASAIGPMQVAGRVGEMAVARRLQPQAVGVLTFALVPPALLVLLLFGRSEAAALVFCILYGVSNGILTIVRGIVPQSLFGRENYGAISGALAAPSLLARAAGPLAAAALIAAHPQPVWLLGTLLLAALVSLACYLAAVRTQRAARPAFPR